MVRTRANAWLGMLAVGLGIGGALASTPGTAAADSSTDWLSSIDTLLSGGAAPAADTTDLAISVDGVTLLQEGTAQAYSGTDGDIAIADGAGSYADATGTDDYAYAEGTDDSAVSGGVGSNESTAFVFGDDSSAFAGGTAANPGAFDGAIIFGNDDTANAGGDAAGPGSGDISYVEGNNLGPADAQGSSYLIDILKYYSDGTTTAATAAENSNFSTELLSGTDTSSALSAGSALWTDLLSSFDGAGAAADASNFWTELASLF